LLTYLHEAAGVAPGVYEIGGPEQVSYIEMMQIYATVRGLARRRIVTVPMLTPRLSAHWVDLVTPVDRAVSHSLIESLTNDVIVNDRERTDTAFTVRPMGVHNAIRAALDRQRQHIPEWIFDATEGLTDGVYTFRSHAALSRRSRRGAELDLADCAPREGLLGWAYWRLLWPVHWVVFRLMARRQAHRARAIAEHDPRVDTGGRAVTS
jgi:hypothetical protein